MTNEELLKDVEYLLELLGTCDYANPFTCKISQKKVTKAYDKLFEIRKKLKGDIKYETN